VKELRDAIARMGPEALELYDAIVAEHVAITKHVLTCKRPSLLPPETGYDANGSPTEEP
jgi:hypothetical protein